MGGSMLAMRILGIIFLVTGLAFLWFAIGRGPAQNVFWFLAAQFVFMGIIFAWIALAMQRGMQHALELAKNGAPATATILDVQDTGVTINNNPRLRLTLSVQPASGDAFQVTAAKTVPRFAPPRVGDVYTIRYDLIKPQDFVFTDEAAQGAMSGGSTQSAAGDKSVILRELLAAATKAETAHADPVARLTELTALRDKGVLTPEQFETLKNKILAES